MRLRRVRRGVGRTLDGMMETGVRACQLLDGLILVQADAHARNVEREILNRTFVLPVAGVGKTWDLDGMRVPTLERRGMMDAV